MISLAHKTAYEGVLKNIETKTGMSIKEIQNASPEELRKRFVKNPFEGLNPNEYRDAKKILRKYSHMEKVYFHFNEIMPSEVIDAQLTISYLH